MTSGRNVAICVWAHVHVNDGFVDLLIMLYHRLLDYCLINEHSFMKGFHSYSFLSVLFKCVVLRMRISHINVKCER